MRALLQGIAGPQGPGSSEQPFSAGRRPRAFSLLLSLPAHPAGAAARRGQRREPPAAACRLPPLASAAAFCTEPCAAAAAAADLTIISLLPTDGADNYTTPIVVTTGGSRGGGGFSLGPGAPPAALPGMVTLRGTCWRLLGLPRPQLRL